MGSCLKIGLSSLETKQKREKFCLKSRNLIILNITVSQKRGRHSKLRKPVQLPNYLEIWLIPLFMGSYFFFGKITLLEPDTIKNVFLY